MYENVREDTRSIPEYDIYRKVMFGNSEVLKYEPEYDIFGIRKRNLDVTGPVTVSAAPLSPLGDLIDGRHSTALREDVVVQAHQPLVR